MDVLFLLGLKLATDLDLSFDGFVDGIERPATVSGELRLAEYSLCSHHPFRLGVRLRPQEHDSNHKEVVWKTGHPLLYHSFCQSNNGEASRQWVEHMDKIPRGA